MPTAQVLVLGAGGAGTDYGSGGGGAGGYQYNPSYSLLSQSYAVTVGLGVYGGNGQNSVFDTITAIGGGGGAYTLVAGSGGSGGGGLGGYGVVPRVYGGTGSQGNNGGNGNPSAASGNGCGGGGGAGTAGAAGSGNNGGSGGDGVINPITGSTIGQNISGSYWVCGGSYGIGGAHGNDGKGAGQAGGNCGGGGGLNQNYRSGAVVISFPTGTFFYSYSGSYSLVQTGGNDIIQMTSSGTLILVQEILSVSVSNSINVSENYSISIPSINLKILGQSPSILDSFSNTGFSGMWFDTTKYYGQSFTSYYNTKLATAKFYIEKVGGVYGDIVVQIYAHTGTYGVNGLPNGSILATSDPIDSSTLPASYYLQPFIFSGSNKIDLIPGTHYFVVMYYPTGGGVNPSIYFERVISGISPGNACSSTDGTSWSLYALPIPFQILGDDGPISDSLNISTYNEQIQKSAYDIFITENIQLTESTIEDKSLVTFSKNDTINISESLSITVSGNYPGTVVTYPIGGFAWFNPQNASDEDSIYALGLFPAFMATQTDYLLASNFNLQISNLATISGILIEIKRLSTAGSITDLNVNIVKSNGIIGSQNKASGVTWPGTNTWFSYGGPTDKWGESWVSTDINNSNFGVALRAQCLGIDSEAWVDSFRVTIYLTFGDIKAVNLYDTLNISESITLSRINAPDRNITVFDSINISESPIVLPRFIFISTSDSINISTSTFITNIYSIDIYLSTYDSIQISDYLINLGVFTEIFIHDDILIATPLLIEAYRFTGGRSPIGERGLSL